MNATGVQAPAPKLTLNATQDVQEIDSFIFQLKERLLKAKKKGMYEQARSKFHARFATGFIYEFSDGDLDRIQRLLTELRAAITNSELFDAKHKQRILNKVESVQGEIHKRMTTVDKLWGLVGEAGVVLGKFGKDAKPFVDRIKEIAEITWATQARAEELPSGTTMPQLTSGDGDEG